jgi:hypothetical protein
MSRSDDYRRISLMRDRRGSGVRVKDPDILRSHEESRVGKKKQGTGISRLIRQLSLQPQKTTRESDRRRPATSYGGV